MDELCESELLLNAASGWCFVIPLHHRAETFTKFFKNIPCVLGTASPLYVMLYFSNDGMRNLPRCTRLFLPEKEPKQAQAPPSESRKRNAAAMHGASADAAAGADGAVGESEGVAGAGATDDSGFWCPPFKVRGRFGFGHILMIGVSDCCAFR